MTALSISQRAMARPDAGPHREASALGAEPDWLASLNPEQRDAVLTTEGPVLMLAGAGTGKTKALTARIAHILATGRARPWQILAVTFTNKAAREMRERVTGLVGPSAEGMNWLGTFHSTSAHMLRRHAELVGLRSSFSILDDDDQERLLKQLIEANGLDPKRWTARALSGLIDGWKNKALTPDKISRADCAHFADGQAADLYAQYQDRLRTLNACDFGDLLLHVIEIFRKHEDVLAEYHQKLRYLLVDEYQDTNVAQYLWLRLLARGSKNICVVGDDDQSIYGWRGAEVDNILRFEHDFPGARIIKLERNYRSTPAILAAASRLISTNRRRLGKTLWTQEPEGDKVLVRGVWDGEAEARLIADDISFWAQDGRRYAQIAVLVRASWQMRAFEERFILEGLPYRVIGGPRFFERAEIRDAHAYLRLIQSPDDDLAFERVVNQPRRGIGDTTIARLSQIARDRRISLMRACEAVQGTDEVKGPARSGLARFLGDLDRWRAAHAAGANHVELAETILDESGYTDMLKSDKSPQASARIDNLKELVRNMGRFDDLGAYLEHVALVMDLERDETGDAVQILTLHASKGLEWPLVFLPGWEETVFPSARALDESGEAGLEEERRLAYVGLTRARESARISFAANRQIYGRWQSVLPSRFVDELPEEAVEAISETGFRMQDARGSGLQEPFARWDAGAGFGSTYESPGWKRAQEFKSAGGRYSSPPTIDAQARLVASSEGGNSAFVLGQRVFHQKFGYGAVRLIEGNKLTIQFDKAGEKKVIDSFVVDAARAG